MFNHPNFVTGLRDFFDGIIGEGRDAHVNIVFRASSRGGKFTVRMGHGLKSSWRDAKGERDLGAKHSSAGVYFGHIHEDTRPKTVLLEGGVVLVDGNLGCRAGIEEV
jgi:hypothetical protein